MVFIKKEFKDIFFISFLLLLPLISIIGTYFVNYLDSNVILFVLLPILSIIPILVVWDKIPEKYFVLALFSIGLSLLFHTSLISNYIWGWDINVEYYYANLVISNKYWIINIPNNVNAMLSIVMLAPIISIITNWDLTLIFKIIYPFLFAFVPVILYKPFKDQTSSKIAFLSSFFIISYSFFFFNAPTGGRQEIAELFLALIMVLLFADYKIMTWKKTSLIIIFLFALTVSHYGTSYIFLLLLTLTSITLLILKNINTKKISKNIVNFTLIASLFIFFWYFYVSSSSAISKIAHIGQNIAENFIHDFLNPEYTQSLSLIAKQYSIPGTIEKYLVLISQLMILLGVVDVVIFKNRFKFSSIFIILGIFALGINFAGLFIPHFANQMNAWRIFHLTLLILAPFGVIGLLRSILFFQKYMRLNSRFLSPMKLTALFFSIFLLANSAWIYGLFNDYPNSLRSLSLYQNEIKRGNGIGEDEFYAAFYEDYDYYSVIWTKTYYDNNRIIFSDAARRILIFSSYGLKPNVEELNINLLRKGDYLYLGYYNLKYSRLFDLNRQHTNLSDISGTMNTSSLIYTNGGAKVFQFG